MSLDSINGWSIQTLRTEGVITTRSNRMKFRLSRTLTYHCMQVLGCHLSGASNDNIVQNHLNVALLNLF